MIRSKFVRTKHKIDREISVSDSEKESKYNLMKSQKRISIINTRFSK